MKKLFVFFWFWLLFPVAAMAQVNTCTASGTCRVNDLVIHNQTRPVTVRSLALFVDPTGNDTGQCTGTGTAACATIQGAINKIPKLARHPVTIDVAAGSFAGFILSEPKFEAAVAATGAFINIRGAAQTNTTPATGTATGTLTAVATDGAGFHLLTDGAQTWTVSDSNVTTRYLTLTGGTGSGQVCPIFANTATTATVACVFSPAPVAGTTYAVTTPPTLLNAAATFPATGNDTSFAAAGMTFVNVGRSRPGSVFAVSVQDIGHDSGAFGLVSVTNSNVLLQRVRNAASTMISSGGGAQIQCTKCVHTGASPALSSSSAVAGQSVIRASSGYFTSSAGVVFAIGAGANELQFTQMQLETSSASAIALQISGHANHLFLNNSRVRCTAASTNVGVSLSSRAISSFAVPLGASTVTLQGGGVAGRLSLIETCGTGLLAEGFVGANIDPATGGVTFLSNTLALSATGGGRVWFSTVPTFTTNTTDISVDGTTSTRAAYVALTPNSIVDLNYLSSVVLQP